MLQLLVLVLEVAEEVAFGSLRCAKCGSVAVAVCRLLQPRSSELSLQLSIVYQR